MINNKKINCIDCKYFNKESGNCSIENGSPIRKCVIAINKDLVDALAGNKSRVKVLEIGCGAWSYLKANLPANVDWEGVDPVGVDKENRRTIATKIGSVERIPFSDGIFDFVLANQSIEHWYEFGVPFKKALSEISRVLKVGGYLQINMPFFLHGHKYFLLGEEDKVMSIFNNKYWSIEKVEDWRKDPAPLPVYEAWKNDHLTVLLANHLVGRCSWVRNVVLRKIGYKKIGFCGQIDYFLSKFLAQLLPNKALKLINYGPGAVLKYVKIKYFKIN